MNYYNTLGCEPFWNDKNAESWTKETWSRLRCGNIGRHNKKGYKAWDCRLCHSEPETIEHLLICREARMLCTPKIADKIQALTDGKYDADLQFLVKELLRGPPNIEICILFKVIENKINSPDGDAEKDYRYMGCR
ncbi:Protein of unknown function [Cotesia congregata]|uniref:Uncharacterized protein n=1 Tax=Cotesia congregata TaxID=51543 RepID=A0A8J2HLK3_COTCN|nr:Protein of unknown function [Cotesia congregata]